MLLLLRRSHFDLAAPVIAVIAVVPDGLSTAVALVLPPASVAAVPGLGYVREPVRCTDAETRMILSCTSSSYAKTGVLGTIVSSTAHGHPNDHVPFSTLSLQTINTIPSCSYSRPGPSERGLRYEGIATMQ